MSCLRQREKKKGNVNHRLQRDGTRASCIGEVVVLAWWHGGMVAYILYGNPRHVVFRFLEVRCKST